MHPNANEKWYNPSLEEVYSWAFQVKAKLYDAIIGIETQLCPHTPMLQLTIKNSFDRQIFFFAMILYTTFIY